MKNILFLFLISTFAVDLFAQTEVLNFTSKRNNYYRLLDTKYVLLPHQSTYLLPFVFNSLPHESIYQQTKQLNTDNNGDLYKTVEAEFQISFMIPVQRSVFGSNIDLNFAYTHHAWWQVYNSDWSRPFRETNYMPEIFVRYVDPVVSKIAGFDFNGVDFGYIHQSNGQVQLLSRSWDRIFARAYLKRSGFLFILKGWYRLPEKSTVDDNKDIYNYMGLGELEIIKSIGKHNFTYKTPLLSHHFSSDLKYSYPWKDRLRWYLSYQAGYGHSMIEYDRPTQRYGAGITLDSIFEE